MFYNDYYYPIDNSIGFIEADFHLVINFYQEWLKRLYGEMGLKVVQRQINGTLADGFQSLLPLTTHQTRRSLFLPTQSRWVAYFNNSVLGTDLSSLPYMTDAIGARVIKVSMPPMKEGRLKDRNHPHGGTIMLDVYDPTVVETLHLRRSIQLINEDGHWSFETQGEPFDFEDTKQYQARLKKDRFTVQTLIEYLRHFGIDLLNETFYISNESILEELQGPLLPQMRAFSIDEALRRFD